MSKKDQPMNDVVEDDEDDVAEEEEEDDEMEVDKDIADDDDHQDEDDDDDDEDEDDTKGNAQVASEDKKEKKKKKSATALPVARIKRIMRTDKDVKLISSDASLLITKSTELFLEYLAKEAFKKTTGKRKLLSYKELSSAVKEIEALEFLADIIPPKVIT
ncbi:hypothetical protein SAMD00019534_097660 [Acytostelium subglobosum LB1]|uniref:hypothetical protein n=1 Tax=Acytostelium subglobosum LB1 TaxID=1410327 RepID=UPI000644ED9D|nr:hypothetical protein SAMD00019534_097660 [Acytostelium subglobosum LB1]GAM26591.1 hypothetical protein SAMD00019534_097660 [Acytostelium subglobosum LB1]|eukprot:XP_012750252.1 hypothetical protein SAMD00019534_097660 [Acytostelium subglobosum LB1]